MKDMGEVSSVLGTKITRDENFINIDQSRYITDVLVRFRMRECYPISTSMDYNQKLSVSMSPENEESKQRMSNISYMQAIGYLLFADYSTRHLLCGKCTLFQIYYVVNVLSRFGTNSGKPH